MVHLRIPALLVALLTLPSFSLPIPDRPVDVSRRELQPQGGDQVFPRAEDTPPPAVPQIQSRTWPPIILEPPKSQSKWFITPYTPFHVQRKLQLSQPPSSLLPLPSSDTLRYTSPDPPSSLPPISSLAGWETPTLPFPNSPISPPPSAPQIQNIGDPPPMRQDIRGESGEGTADVGGGMDIEGGNHQVSLSSGPSQPPRVRGKLGFKPKAATDPLRPKLLKWRTDKDPGIKMRRREQQLAKEVWLKQNGKPPGWKAGLYVKLASAPQVQLPSNSAVGVSSSAPHQQPPPNSLPPLPAPSSSLPQALVSPLHPPPSFQPPPPAPEIHRIDDTAPQAPNAQQVGTSAMGEPNVQVDTFKSRKKGRTRKPVPPPAPHRRKHNTSAKNNPQVKVMTFTLNQGMKELANSHASGASNAESGPSHS